MFRKIRQFKIAIATVLLTAMVAGAQDLVPVSSLTGGSSVFVFRNAARTAKKFTPTSKPKRTKAQRIETVAKVKKQYETIAKVAPKRAKSKVADPLNPPKNIRTLPPAQGSKLFAGFGEYYSEKGEYEKSIEYYRDASALDETNKAAKAGLSEALAIKGNDLLVKDQAAMAKGVFLEALKFDSNNAAAYFGLAEVYAELDQIDEAIANYEKSLAFDKDLTEIYVPLGVLYYQKGEIAKADTFLTKALALSPNSAETQFFLGLVRSAQDKNVEALAAFQKAKSLDPTQPETYLYEAETLVRLKRTGDAIASFKKATELKPNYFDAWLGLGEAEYELGNYAEAIKAFKAAVKLKNNDWAVFAGLGESYRLNKEFDNATGAYRNAALFYTQQKDFNKETAADLYSKIGLSIGQQCDINMERAVVCQWPSAIKALEKAAELTNNPIDQVNLGWAYFRLAHPDAEARNLSAAKPNLDIAKEILQKAVAAGPPASDFALQNLASVQIDLGDYKGAIDTLTKLVDRKPDLNFARYALGVAYFKNNDLNNAEKWLRAAIQNEPQNIGYMMALGDTLIGRKNGKEARKIVDMLRPLSAEYATRLDRKIQLAKL
ncbi:MAG: tetratricopeptide repeat protein [Pyrinomonadaceae bacterium]